MKFAATIMNRPRSKTPIKNPWTLLLLAAAGTWAMSVMAAGGNNDPRPPVLPPEQRPMANSYNVLLDRSIFSKDHNRPAAILHTATTTRPSEVVVTSETNLVLRGVGVADGQATAFFEQVQEQKMMKVRLGEPLLNGLITASTLDGVDYVVGGKASHILIGQALDGGVAVVTPNSPPPSTEAPLTSKWIKKHHKE